MLFLSSSGWARPLAVVALLLTSAAQAAPSVLRKLQGVERTETLDDGSVVTITISGNLCSAYINIPGEMFRPFGCNCFKPQQASCAGETVVTFDCSRHSDDPCARQDCAGTCLNEPEAAAAPVDTQQAPTPTEAPSPSPVIQETPVETDAPSGAPSPAPSPSPLLVEPQTASPSPNNFVPPPVPPPVETSTEAPSTPSPVVTETDAPTGSPTTSPVATETDAPTGSPTISPVVTEEEGSPTVSPVMSTTDAPTATPVAAPTTESPVVNGGGDGGTTGSPIASPTTSAPVANLVGPSQCELNPVCNGLNLTGSCCPTMDDVFLDCCDGVELQGTCEANDQCDKATLTGDCCPTKDGWGYLTCCDAVGDECLDGNCTLSETSDYLAFLAGDQDASSINSGAARLSTTTMMMILSTLMVAAVWW